MADDRLIAALNNVNIALNNLNQTLVSVLPGGNTISGSAGAASGSYLAITVNGTAYKIALLATS